MEDHLWDINSFDLGNFDDAESLNAVSSQASYAIQCQNDESFTDGSTSTKIKQRTPYKSRTEKWWQKNCQLKNPDEEAKRLRAIKQHNYRVSKVNLNTKLEQEVLQLRQELNEAKIKINLYEQILHINQK